MKKLAIWISMTGILAFAAFDQRGPSGEADDAAEDVASAAGERSASLPDATEQARELAQHAGRRLDKGREAASDTQS